MKRILIITALTLGAHCANAQYVTYNHDDTKMNQITVMETGAGRLTPALFYNVLHNKYEKTAAETNKMSYRTEASAVAYSQVSLAEQIDSALTKRAKVEALNMADREIDIAWLAEGSKIEAKMQDFQDNINRIVPAGGTPDDRIRWTEYYNVYKTAINATKEAYMPNAQRKRQYLAIYDDLTGQNETLIHFIVMLNSKAHTAQALNASIVIPNRNGEIAKAARNRWRSNTTSNVITE